MLGGKRDKLGHVFVGREFFDAIFFLKNENWLVWADCVKLRCFKRAIYIHTYPHMHTHIHTHTYTSTHTTHTHLDPRPPLPPPLPTDTATSPPLLSRTDALVPAEPVVGEGNIPSREP